MQGDWHASPVTPSRILPGCALGFSYAEFPHTASVAGQSSTSTYGSHEGKGFPQADHALEISLGVNHDPLWSQYFQYINNLLHGNLGISITYLPTPVTAVISQDLPWTLVLVGVASLLALCGYSAGYFRRLAARFNDGSFFHPFSLSLCHPLFLVGPTASLSAGIAIELVSDTRRL